MTGKVPACTAESLGGCNAAAAAAVAVRASAKATGGHGDDEYGDDGNDDDDGDDENDDDNGWNDNACDEICDENDDYENGDDARLMTFCGKCPRCPSSHVSRAAAGLVGDLPTARS